MTPRNSPETGAMSSLTEIPRYLSGNNQDGRAKELGMDMRKDTVGRCQTDLLECVGDTEALVRNEERGKRDALCHY